MMLRLAKLQNLLWRCSFAQTICGKCIRTSDTTHASMAWRTAYFNYGIRWSISIGVLLYLHTDGDRSPRRMCRNLN